ncbi:MAG: T6SS effector amidase Tae4 family protein [Porphyromonadaceae bacterium]|nr:T6SS effector amidase Tae4 family protein [Porphyromonadaceae bacterium]
MKILKQNRDALGVSRRADRATQRSAPSRQMLVQPKLELTTLGDSYEREADRMADYVMRKPFGVSSISMPSTVVANQPKILRRATGSYSDIAVDSATESGIHASRGGGQPLPTDLRARMESGFGTDFSGVRLHTGSAAETMSSDLNAKAFTYGNDIYFNRGQYSPDTTAGQHLIAHELTHVVQQSGKVGRKPTGKSLSDNYPLEDSFNNKDIFEYIFYKNKRDWIHTCATRVSIAFVRSGVTISGGYKVNKESDFYKELKTEKEIKVIVGVREMQQWLKNKYGNPIEIYPQKGNKLVTIKDVQKKINNKKGVLLMKKFHVTLWTGKQCIRRDYYEKERVYFWEFKNG